MGIRTVYKRMCGAGQVNSLITGISCHDIRHKQRVYDDDEGSVPDDTSAHPIRAVFAGLGGRHPTKNGSAGRGSCSSCIWSLDDDESGPLDLVNARPWQSRVDGSFFGVRQRFRSCVLVRVPAHWQAHPRIAVSHRQAFSACCEPGQATGR